MLYANRGSRCDFGHCKWRISTACWNPFDITKRPKASKETQERVWQFASIIRRFETTHIWPKCCTTKTCYCWLTQVENLNLKILLYHIRATDSSRLTLAVEASPSRRGAWYICHLLLLYRYAHWQRVDQFLRCWGWLVDYRSPQGATLVKIGFWIDFATTE